MNAENLDKVLIKMKLLEQAVLFEIILNQYAYEAQNLMNLINSISNGNVYTNIFSPGKLIKELKEIKNKFTDRNFSPNRNHCRISPTIT